MPEFNVLNVRLEGSKLVEASAGTGKTYSIAILALRLIVEEKIPIEKMLMVTFTKAAVAELESRIRKFVRLAYKFATGQAIKDSTVQAVVGAPDEDKIRLLKKAVQSLDNLSVMTIHSFCLSAIDEFTFEAGQSFDYEIVQDDSVFFREMVQTYRREVVNTIQDFEWFKEINTYLKFDKMSDILRKCLDGMAFLDIDLNQQHQFNETIQQSIEAYQQLINQIELNFNRIQVTNVRANSRLANNRETKEQFLPIFIQDCCFAKKYTKEFAFLYDPYGKDYAESFQKVKHCFYTTFINTAKATIHQIKQEKGLLSYDDQIKTIHQALGNESFKAKLADKYDAVFIDEFQDTDKQQYEIFKNIFSNNSIVYFIGDPKQSIFGWRSADLDTYKAAKVNVGEEAVYSMNKNYRSTPKMINALNVLLRPHEGFNLFMDNDIRYINVESGATNLEKMLDQGEEVKPITVWQLEEQDFDTNYKAVAQEIYRLLTTDVTIKGQRIMPKDIGVLVREKKEGDAIKKALARYRIPSVKRDEAKVLDSEESEMIKYLLKAVISPNTGNINRALHFPHFGFTLQDFITLDEAKHLEIFIGLKKTLIDEGVYPMISSFLTIYGMRSQCMNDIIGQRVLTNINQIAEILHKTEKKEKYTPDELIVWMERNKGESDEEYEQRIESDEDAVQISTIHKAKGLEYKIVFAPCLCMIKKEFFLKRGNVNQFKKEGQYCFTLNYPVLCETDKKSLDDQQEQENRRLIYVALTRAVYKCYITSMPRFYYNNPKPTSLKPIMDEFDNNPTDLIEIKPLSKDTIDKATRRYITPNQEVVFTSRPFPDITITNTFGIHSYSALSRAHHSFVFEKMVLTEEYDHFIFQDLGRGANVGTALHSIFEHLNFADAVTWEETLKSASKYYSTIVKEEKLELFKQLVSHVMNVGIKGLGEEFSLNKISNSQKLPELEFCFSMNSANKAEIDRLLGDEADLNGEATIEGLMTGFIDLLFEHNGKYYILDWKSNHLGNSVESYGRTGMEEAMKGNNYNLQYMIYTLAVKRWLETKIRDFDYDRHLGGVIYVFLRGVREELESGIYVKKPSKEKIEALDQVFLQGR